MKNSDSVFSKENIIETVSVGYFRILAAFFNHPETLEVLEQCHIFTTFHRLVNLETRTDIIELIMNNLDYGRYSMFGDYDFTRLRTTFKNCVF